MNKNEISISMAACLQQTSMGLRLTPATGFNSDAPAKLLILLEEAAGIAGSANKPLTVRVLVSAFDLTDLAGSISALGFRKMYDRVEYVHALDDSIPEDGPVLKPDHPRLKWVSGLKYYNLDTLGSIYRAAAFSDPSGDIPADTTSADFRKDIDEHLADQDFHPSADAIQIGLVNGQPAAFVFAQVLKHPYRQVTLEGERSIKGWARLTYLGILPAYRGRGYGRQAHRHGLRTLRDMGGLNYHGGTARDNAAMRRLFESSGCVLLRLLEGWRLPAS